MPFTRFALILCYVFVAAGITVFLVAQFSPQGDAQALSMVVLPIAMVAGIVIRSLHMRLERKGPKN